MSRSTYRRAVALLAAAAVPLLPVPALAADPDRSPAVTTAQSLPGPSVAWSSPADGARVRSPGLVSMTYDDEIAGSLPFLVRVQAGRPDEVVGCPTEQGWWYVGSHVSCRPYHLADGTYRLQSRGQSRATGRPALGSVTFVVDSTAAPAPTLEVGPVGRAAAAAAPVGGEAPDGTVVDVQATDANGVEVRGTAVATGGRWSAALDLRGLQDGVLHVVASTSDAAAVPVEAHVLKDTVAPAVLSFSPEPLGSGTRLRWSAVVSEERATVHMAVTDRHGLATSKDVSDTYVYVSAPDGTVTQRYPDGEDVARFADGPLSLSLRLQDRAGNDATVAVGAVVKEIVPTIDRTHARLLAAGLDLGLPVGAQREEPCTRRPYCAVLRSRPFQHGEIWSSDSFGTHEVHGAVLAAWRASGGAHGRLGMPLSDELPAGPGRVSRFEDGDIFWSPATGAHALLGDVLAAYRATGGVSGPLGFPVAGTGGPSGPAAGDPWQVSVTPFQHGRIYEVGGRGALAVYGEIYRHFVASGDQLKLGVPVTPELSAPGGARVSGFSGGARVYWSPATGAVAVHGAILQRYDELGGVAALGLPVTDEVRVAGGPGAYVQQSLFQRGALVWSRATGVKRVEGAILAKYAQPGVARVLGAPTTDEVAVRGGRGSSFQGGQVLWSPATGAHEVHGGIGAAYAAAGGPDGRLGLPTTDEYVVGSEPRSDFQGGSIRWTPRGAVVRLR